MMQLLWLGFTLFFITDYAVSQFRTAKKAGGELGHLTPAIITNLTFLLHEY